jgi:hypothetical protein
MMKSAREIHSLDVEFRIPERPSASSTKVTLHLWCDIGNVTLHYYSALNAG